MRPWWPPGGLYAYPAASYGQLGAIIMYKKINFKKAATANCDIYIWTMDLLMEHDVHNLILDFWILDLVCLRIFVFWVLKIHVLSTGTENWIWVGGGSLRVTRPTWRACLTPGAVASLRGTRPAWRAFLTPFFLNFEFDLSYYMCACDDYHTLLIYIRTYIHTCIIIHTYIIV